MSVLAFKALSMGAEQIPDKFFEKIPGGFFTPQEKKDIDKGRKDRKDKDRHHDDQRRSKRSSQRERSPATDYSDYSGYDDTDREREQRRKDRRRERDQDRASRSQSQRGYDRSNTGALDGEYNNSRNMAQPEQGAPYFPPPPTAEYRPYNPQDHSSRPAHDNYPPSPAGYGYVPQVNRFSRPRGITLPTTLPSTPEHPTPMASRPPKLRSRTVSAMSSPFAFQRPPLYETLSRGTPVSATFSPSHEPPLAALLHRSPTDTPKPAAQPAQDAPRSASSRYVPGPGYAPSPPVNSAPIPPPPVGFSSPPYAPYNPAEFTQANNGYQAPGNAYPSPPPLSRARSNSQPSTYVPYQTYIPPSASQQQVAAYDDPPSRRGSTKPRREHRHRARSADTHSHSSKDTHREDSRMAKVRGRFDDMDLRERGLAAAVGGALAGGFAGRQLGKSRLTTLAGAAAGALGGRAIADKRSKSRGPVDHRSRSRSRSRSRARTKDRDYSRERSKSRGGGLRARSKSIIDRFRSKSRGPDEKDSRSDRRNRSRDRRPDRGYDYDRDRDEYDYFSSESEGDGSPVQRRRRRKDY